jgi:SAM-dependent methyltransferase
MISVDCALCGSSGPHPTVMAQEMMFRRGESFEYVECSSCGSLQIIKPPEDLSRFYPAEYYAHGAARSASFRERLETIRDRVLFETGPLGGRTWGAPFFAHVLHSLKRDGLRKTSRVLDVGCGTGALLVSLRKIGFSRLYGVDPYAVNTSPDPLVHIRCGGLHEIEDSFDLIIFNHSLEHVSEPVQLLRQARDRLTPNGRVIVRVPIAGCFAWRSRGADWIQWDAPRHLVLPTVRGLEAGASQAGLRTTRVVFDSYWLQFVGAEIYSAAPGQGLPAAIRQAPLSKDQMKVWQKKAHELNATGDGDQATFVLTPAN